MKVSLNLMKMYSDAAQWELSLAELVAKIGSQLGAVEETIDLSDKYKGAVIAKIVSCHPHTGSDHLNICMVDDGGVVKNIPRDANGYVQVVCGAPNVRQDLLVVWLPPETVVPESFGKAEPFVLGARAIRGELSNGMLASLKELDVSDDHSGIAEVDVDAKPGTAFAKAYGLENDAIIDIENKMFTHRPDGFGNLGVAREIAGIQNLPFQSPDWYSTNVELPKATGEKLGLEVVNEIPELVPRYMAVVLGDITVKPSPIWLQSCLRRLGVRPINNVVDITNYMMLVTGQPLHAFDYDKVTGQKIIIRKPKQGEKLPLLDGKIIEPHKDAMLICDAQKPIGLGGMMGGANSEIDAKTTRVVLECATFDMFTIRRTSMHHGIFTDAVTRYSKGQSPLQCAPVLAKTVADLLETGARVAADTIDIQPKPRVQKPVVLTAEFINARLGSTLQANKIATLLNNVECAVEEHGNELVVTPPFWRTDLEIPEDIVEEVGRMHGYQNLPHSLPTREMTATDMPPIDELKNRIRAILARAGASELQTYSFVPARLLQQVGQEKAHAFSIRNAISPELEHYRLSLTPNLLEKVHPNIKAGYGQFGLFEINKIHIKGEQNLDCDGLPREYQTVAFVFASSTKEPGAAYYHAKKYLDYLLQELGVKAEFKAVESTPGFEIGRQVFAPFEQKRSAYVYAPEGDFAGFIGEYRAVVSKNLKLPAVCAGFEIDLERLLKHQHHLRYQPLLKFPATEQDVCLKVRQEVTYAELETLVSQNLSTDERLRLTVAPLDIYQRGDDKIHKQITFRLTLQHHDRTLTTTEVNDMLDAMVQKIDAKVGAERI
jgi:phenylalanyl-tRNA synthetase beta chain